MPLIARGVTERSPKRFERKIRERFYLPLSSSRKRESIIMTPSPVRRGICPSQTKASQYLCPHCHKKLTVGVMHRVDELSNRPEGFVPKNAIPRFILFHWRRSLQRPWVPDGTKSVESEYERLVEKGGSEFHILLDATPDELKTYVPERILEGILRMRQGKVSILPA